MYEQVLDAAKSLMVLQVKIPIPTSRAKNHFLDVGDLTTTPALLRFENLCLLYVNHCQSWEIKMHFCINVFTYLKRNTEMKT